MRTAACECVGRSRPEGPGDALLTMAANLRIQIHFTPTSGSWLNLVEIWFGIIERQAIHRGIFASVREVMIKIRTFNQRLERPLPSPHLDQDRRPDFQESQPSNNSSCGPQVMQNTYSRGGSRTVTDRLTACLTQPQLRLFLLLRKAGFSCCFQGGATETEGAASV